MRAEFIPDDGKDPVGAAAWEGASVSIETEDPDVRGLLEWIFRPSPVVADDASVGDPAASGPSAIEPGDLTWFRTAALVRGRAVGWRVRFVTETPGGWDPAGAYRPLEAWVDTREGRDTPPRTLGTSRA